MKWFIFLSVPTVAANFNTDAQIEMRDGTVEHFPELAVPVLNDEDDLFELVAGERQLRVFDALVARDDGAAAAAPGYLLQLDGASHGSNLHRDEMEMSQSGHTFCNRWSHLGPAGHLRKKEKIISSNDQFILH